MKDKERKNYTVSLNEKKTDYVKMVLKKSGITLSGFVDAAISEYYDNLKEMTEFYKKKPEEMTVSEFLNALSVFMGRMMKSPSEEKEKEIEERLKEND